MKTYLNVLATILVGVVVLGGSFAVWVIPHWSLAGHIGLQCAVILVVAVILYIVASEI